ETQDYIAKFIEKSLANPRPVGGEYYSRWFEDGTESSDPHDQFWYHDKEMVDLTKARYKASLDKKKQYLSAKVNGNVIPFNPDSHIKMNITIDTPEFTVEPYFVNENHDSECNDHASVKPRVVILSGPVIQTGEYSFRYDPDYFGKDPKRLWSGITLCLEADSDNNYKSAVQEMNIRLNITE
ncbi:MAG: hypothetical protein K2I16_08135, partial [Muribaculaceae bacterium]|nr:hypothetical protein [Muribaculaceae bacterium]